MKADDPGKRSILASVVAQSRSEQLLNECLELPAGPLNHFKPAITQMLQYVCVDERPIEGQGGAFEREPRAIPQIRAKLFARSQLDDGAATACLQMLQAIDEWREGYGDPLDEARHPDLSVQKAWPPVGQLAWDASQRLRKGKKCAQTGSALPG